MGTLFSRLGDFLHGKRPWYDLPRLLAMPRLIEIRNDLRQKNLYDTEEPALEKIDPATVEAKLKSERTLDGTHNDLAHPRMGAVGARFGRNMPLDKTVPDAATFLEPNPRLVSRQLMTRHEFQPASILNLSAAAWLQFMVHDWFAHKKHHLNEDPVEIPLEDDDPWPHRPMRIRRTVQDAAPAGSTRPPAYTNEVTHWWDGSQVYGCDVETLKRLRTFEGGKLKMEADGKLPIDPENGLDLTGLADNWWVGISLMHHLFAAEHNAICGMFRAKYPAWTDEQLFQRARLVNAALMAKIHTVEWTPAIVPHPVIKIAMNTNWNGLAGENLQDVFEFLDDKEVLGGIVGSKADHHAAPYSLTEEFVAVYRMHPLMPDDLTFRRLSDDSVSEKRELPEVHAGMTRSFMNRHSFADLWYSMGRMHPGAIRLHNYPRFLQDHTRDSGEHFDLAMIDIFRDRERGVPRYNEFRRLLRKDPVKDFEELTDNAVWREEIRALYKGDIEKVDLMVGLFAEPLPEGFGFSETAFRIFVLMASRRLKSDRFYTDDFRPEIYTQEGLDYIRHNGMKSVLARHVPELKPVLDKVENAFEPWPTLAGPAVKP